MNTNILEDIGKAAKEASYALADLSATQKNILLLSIAEQLEANQDKILAANSRDMTAAKESGLDEAMLDRLALTPERIKGIANDVRNVSSLEDPVGRIIDGHTLDSGLKLTRKRVPLGVVAAIYEARPNVTVDVAALCLKTGNAVILRGGKETRYSNEVLASIIQSALSLHGLSPQTVQAITDPDRKLVTALLQLDQYVDMLIPRGGAGLHKLCRENSRIPVITGGIGVCHIFVDESAVQTKALEVLTNAKMQRPSVCNALETILVHKNIAPEFIKLLATHFAPLKINLHPTSQAEPYLNTAGVQFTTATQESLSNEWLSLDANLHVVDNLQEAIAHIRKYGSGHSDAILTESLYNAEKFIQAVDSSAVYVNASTRFTDGAQFGLGAEVAISTQKLHARGPMGLEALTTYKWIGQGDYTVRA